MTRIYNNTYYKHYTTPFGYTWQAMPLPDYLHITISNDGESKQLHVHSRIHLNTSGKVGCSYSTDFSDTDIIREQSAEVLHRWG